MMVFTNGCFDILHSGHVRLLKFCKQAGGRLVVGLNSDASVRKLKGPTRPIMPLVDRLEILEAIKYVDEVVVFDEASVEPLLHKLRPDVLVKGPECRFTGVVGRTFVESYGGRVIVPDWEVEVSTSMVIQRVMDAQRQRCWED